MQKLQKLLNLSILIQDFSIWIPDNHEDSINESEIINHWYNQYGIEYLVSVNPVDTISKCSACVLLSYNEGLEVFLTWQWEDPL